MLSQREVIRDLVARFGMNQERVIREYAAAERRGEVERKSNKHHLGSETYARALWADAVRKGWIGGEGGVIKRG
jgi:hypothetical protein